MKKFVSLLITLLMLCSCAMAEEADRVVDLVRAETGTLMIIDAGELSIECLVPENVDVVTHKSTKAECEDIGYNYKVIQERWKAIGEQLRMIDDARSWEISITTWESADSDYSNMSESDLDSAMMFVQFEYFLENVESDKFDILGYDVCYSEHHPFLYNEMISPKGIHIMEYRTDVKGMTVCVVLTMVGGSQIGEESEVLKQFMGSLVITGK